MYYGQNNIIFYIFTSLIHVLPEPLIGTTRLVISLYKLIKGNFIWIPSNIIFTLSSQNNFKSSIYYFGIYSIITLILFILYYSINFLLALFLISILPLYNIITNFKIIYPFKIRLRKITKLKNIKIIK